MQETQPPIWEYLNILKCAQARIAHTGGTHRNHMYDTNESKNTCKMAKQASGVSMPGGAKVSEKEKMPLFF